MVQPSCKFYAFIILIFSITTMLVFGQERAASSVHEVSNRFEHPASRHLLMTLISTMAPVRAGL